MGKTYRARQPAQTLLPPPDPRDWPPAEHVACRALAAGNRPDFRTISDFRKIHIERLEGLFEQVLRPAPREEALPTAGL